MSLKKLLAGVLALGMCACCLNYTNAMKPARGKNNDIPKPEIIQDDRLVAVTSFPSFLAAQNYANDINLNGFEINGYKIRATAVIYTGQLFRVHVFRGTYY